MISQRTIQRRATKLLTHAQALLEKPNGWCRNDFAKTSNNKSVGVSDPAACKFCTVGALRRAELDLGYDHSIKSVAQSRLEFVLGEDPIEVNDRRSTKKEHLMMAFDLAILGAANRR